MPRKPALAALIGGGEVRKGGHDLADLIEPGRLENTDTNVSDGSLESAAGALEMPEGWAYDDTGALCRVRQLRRGVEYEPIYPGKLEVIGTGADVHTGSETLSVRFIARGRPVTVTAPRRELAKARGVIDFLADRGASVTDETARKVARFLAEYAMVNADAVPHEANSDRYGLTPDAAALVLPAGSVETETRYSGRNPAKIGKARTAYRDTLEAVFGWGESAWVVCFTLGLALASPFMRRLNATRYPVIYLAGSSGAGKTTSAKFAVGLSATRRTRR